MEQFDLLRFVVAAIERVGLRYFVTGSTVTIFYGEPRFTNDIDIVVNLSAPAVREFVQQFPENEFYVSEDAALDAVERHSQFKILHPQTGLKVDVIIPAPTEFNLSRFARASRVRTGPDWDAAFSSPEDAIIKKMEYFREGGSEKHLRDIAGVLRTSKESIDMAYIDRWAGILNVQDIWKSIQDRLR